ncbi:hypothetical protein BC938DRAFT_480292 [Jimgerdemannia flammicorona]|uniref:Uncharacterized protein n=1 Tax=Jimgerdemannia flammicorona TaxID=994334 RepID=A0A433QJ22_9FUNG|nr:hypothetical protein BC938DRAFT_480292 [Jimgerdemannia flammicorona]
MRVGSGSECMYPCMHKVKWLVVEEHDMTRSNRSLAHTRAHTYLSSAPPHDLSHHFVLLCLLLHPIPTLEPPRALASAGVRAPQAVAKTANVLPTAETAHPVTVVTALDPTIVIASLPVLRRERGRGSMARRPLKARRGLQLPREGRMGGLSKILCDPVRPGPYEWMLSFAPRHLCISS